MFGKFHDNDYDGIVLKIPTWFISLNGIDSNIVDLYNVLKLCNKSMLYSDHLDNIYELENFTIKKQIVKKKKDEADELKRKREESFQKLIKEEEYELVWIKEDKHYFNQAVIKYKGKIYDESDWNTKNYNLKSTFNTELKKLIGDTFKDFIDFIITTNYSAAHSCRMVNEECVNINFNFYQTRRESFPSMSFERLYIKHSYEKNKNGDYKYCLNRLAAFKNGDYGIDIGGNLEDIKLLKDFKKSGLKLIK